jgi:hypothetical protein
MDTQDRAAHRSDTIDHQGRWCILTLYQDGHAKRCLPLFDSQEAAQRMLAEIMAADQLWRLLQRRGVTAAFPFPI